MAVWLLLFWVCFVFFGSRRKKRREGELAGRRGCEKERGREGGSRHARVNLRLHDALPASYLYIYLYISFLGFSWLALVPGCLCVYGCAAACVCAGFGFFKRHGHKAKLHPSSGEEYCPFFLI